MKPYRSEVMFEYDLALGFEEVRKKLLAKAFTVGPAGRL